MPAPSKTVIVPLRAQNQHKKPPKPPPGTRSTIRARLIRHLFLRRKTCEFGTFFPRLGGPGRKTGAIGAFSVPGFRHPRIGYSTLRPGPPPEPETQSTFRSAQRMWRYVTSTFRCENRHPAGFIPAFSGFIPSRSGKTVNQSPVRPRIPASPKRGVQAGTPGVGGIFPDTWQPAPEPPAASHPRAGRSTKIKKIFTGKMFRQSRKKSGNFPLTPSAQGIAQ